MLLISRFGNVHIVAIIPIKPMITGKTGDGNKGTLKNMTAPERMPHISAIYKPLFKFETPPLDIADD
ncbi:hypothetical protein [Staphylococcus chromogenes]|uniref:hypothetical protein n=1 Tax=Staphylococcus chromogenes TaxID=46126 RepID=UPI0015FA9E53